MTTGLCVIARFKWLVEMFLLPGINEAFNMYTCKCNIYLRFRLGDQAQSFRIKPTGDRENVLQSDAVNQDAN